MTDKELNELLYALENAGYDAEVVHDAIEQIEAESNCDIIEFDNFEAAIEIVHLIDMWRKFDYPTESIKQIRYAFETIINVANHIENDEDAKNAIEFVAKQEIKAIDADLKGNKKDGE